MSMWKPGLLAAAILLGFALIGEASGHLGPDAKNFVLTLLLIVAPTTLCIVGALLNGERYGDAPRPWDFRDDDDAPAPAPAPRPVLLAERVTTTVTERLYGYADSQPGALPAAAPPPVVMREQQPARALPPPVDPFVVRPAHDRPAAFVTCGPHDRPAAIVMSGLPTRLEESDAWLEAE